MQLGIVDQKSEEDPINSTQERSNENTERLMNVRIALPGSSLHVKGTCSLDSITSYMQNSSTQHRLISKGDVCRRSWLLLVH